MEMKIPILLFQFDCNEIHLTKEIVLEKNLKNKEQKCRFIEYTSFTKAEIGQQN